MRYWYIFSVILMLIGCNQEGEQAKVKNLDPTEKEESLKLVFGVYASDKPSEVVAQFKPLLNQLEISLEKQLDRKVEIKIDVAPSYEDGIGRVVEEKNDFSRLGPASYVLAKKQNDGLSILAVESSKGKKTFNGVIAVHEDSTIAALSELKGKRFAFGSERSTIGRYLSQEMLVESGVKAGDLSSYKYLKRHDAVGAAIGAKSFEAGALKESTFKKLKKKGTPLRALIKFKNITKPWVVTKKCDPKVAAALKKALLELKDKAALEALGKQGFLTGEDRDYDGIRKSIDNNGKFFEK